MSFQMPYKKGYKHYKKKGKGKKAKKAFRKKGLFRKSTSSTVAYYSGPGNRFAYLPRQYYTTMRFKSGFEISETISGGAVVNYKLHPNNIVQLMPGVVADIGCSGVDELALLWTHWYCYAGKVTFKFYPATTPDSSTMLMSLQFREEDDQVVNQQELQQQSNASQAIMLPNVIKPAVLSRSWNLRSVYMRNIELESFIGATAATSAGPNTKVEGRLTVASSSLTDTSIDISGVVEFECKVKWLRLDRQESFSGTGLIVSMVKNT